LMSTLALAGKPGVISQHFDQMQNAQAKIRTDQSTRRLRPFFQCVVQVSRRKRSRILNANIDQVSDYLDGVF